jgi:peptide/nickel transport system substrate-binding protein
MNMSISRWLAAASVVAMLVGSSMWAGPVAFAGPSGDLTVLEPASTTGTWTGLDPATDTTSAENYDFLNAIYGELFEQGANGKIVPDLATGYKVVDQGLEVDIMLRHGVTFTDGTPFNAAAVVSNIDRDLAPATGCVCASSFSAVTSTTAVGDYEVVLHLSHPDTAIVEAFFSEAPNWIASPSALAKMGAAPFALNPVGAGPFEVVSDIPSNTLSLKANPTYWEQGHPELSALTFKSIGSDVAGLQALQAGSAQAYVGLTSTAVLDQAKADFKTSTAPATETYSVDLNPNVAPFNNILAREAIYYATDAQAIDQHIVDGTGELSESPTGPGDEYWTPKVPGYRSYDPAKAKAIVQKLGGLSFTLSAVNSAATTPIIEAEQSEWSQVGIKATISLQTSTEILQLRSDGGIQAEATQIGATNPALVPGVSFKFASDGAGSTVRDKKLDAMLTAAQDEPNAAKAGVMYRSIFSYLSQQAYAVFLFTRSAFNVSTKAVTGLSGTLPRIDWEDVGI